MIRGKFLTSRDDVSAVFELRRKVFCEEQGFSVEGEIDDGDKMAVYAIAYDDNDMPIATGRLCIRDDHFTVGRVCVLKPYRGMQVGDFIMRMLLYRAQDLNAGSVYLSAQYDKVDFYRRYGFEPYGEIVLDESYPHRMMKVDGDKINIEGTCGCHNKACEGCQGDCESCGQK